MLFRSWSYGSPGVGTVGHLGMELLKSRSAIKAVHVPYTGYPQVFNGIQGGDLKLSMLPPALAMTQIQAGKLHGIGVTSAARSPLAPGLPSLKELGVNNFDLEIWNAVAAPRSMPKAHVDKLAAACAKAVKAPDALKRLQGDAAEPIGSTPEQFAQFIATEQNRWQKVLKRAQVKPG